MTEELSSLVVRAQAGDLGAFASIVRRLQDMAYGYAYALLGDFHLAQDAAQEAFLQCWRDLASLRRPEAFAGWFRRIVLKHCDRLTRGKRVPTAALEAAADVPAREANPADRAERREMADAVLEAIAALPDAQRAVTTLFYIDGYSHKEIAEFLGVPATTVNNRLHTSRARLRERMLKMVDETLKGRRLPAEFAELVVRMVATEADLKGVIGVMPHRKDLKQVADAREQEVFVVEEGGRVTSAGELGVTTWTLGSTVVKAARSGEIAGESEGVPDPIFVRGYQAHFKLARERGIHLALVHGSTYDHAFCGFVPCFYHPVATVPTERVRAAATRATVRPARDDAERQTGWQAYIHDPYATKIGGGCPGPITHVVEQGGEPVGYLGWAGWGCHSLTLTTREAALAALKFIADESGEDEVGVLESHRTLATQTILRLGGKYLLRPSCDLVALDNEMAAILDLAGLSGELAEEFQARLDASRARDTDGALSIEMQGGTVGFVVRSGRVKIATRKQKTHRPLPRWLVTRLYIGYYSGEDVLAMGPFPDDRSDGKTPDHPDLDMQEFRLPEREAALFQALFPRLWPCSMPDPDVWPWVIGEEHPRYRNGDDEPEERKARIDALRLPWIGY